MIAPPTIPRSQENTSDKVQGEWVLPREKHYSIGLSNAAPYNSKSWLVSFMNIIKRSEIPLNLEHETSFKIGLDSVIHTVDSVYARKHNYTLDTETRINRPTSTSSCCHNSYLHRYGQIATSGRSMVVINTTNSESVGLANQRFDYESRRK